MADFCGMPAWSRTNKDSTKAKVLVALERAAYAGLPIVGLVTRLVASTLWWGDTQLPEDNLTGVAASDVAV